MTHLAEPAPPYDQPLPAASGVRRVVAANPGPMTYHGTNTYLIDTPGGTVVLDPGPDDPAHIAAIMAAVGRIAAILVTHRHPDHVGGAAALRRAANAPVLAYEAADGDPLHPDGPLADGAEAHGLLALHTPGHAADHLCFALTLGDGTRALFSGDHVMGWSSSVVSPPGGDMRAYLASLERLLGRDDDVYFPGHGPPIAAPQARVRALLDHRLEREASILRLIAAAPAETGTIVGRIYGALDPKLRPAAERSALAHLLKLEAEARITRDGGRWQAL